MNIKSFASVFISIFGVILISLLFLRHNNFIFNISYNFLYLYLVLIVSLSYVMIIGYIWGCADEHDNL
jgi:hypothetical protein